MNWAIRAALFASVVFGMGALFGIFIAFFTREYTIEEVVKSRIHRMNIIDGRLTNASE